MKDTIRDRIGRMRRSTFTAILWTIAAALLLAAIRRKAPPGPVAIGALIILILDIGRFSVHLVPSIGGKEYAETAFPRSETVRFLDKDPDTFRVLVTDDVIGWRMHANHPELYPERPTVFGIQTVRGYNPTILGDYSAFINRMQGRPEAAWPGGLLFLPDARQMDRGMLDALNVKYLVSYQPAPATFETALTDGDLKVYRNLQVLPRAYVVRDGTPASDPVEITKYTPNRVVVEADLDEPGTLVLADTWFTGWKVKVDGNRAELQKRDEVFRSVDLPAGKHDAVFVYAPASFYEGLALSCVGFILFIGLVGVPGKARWDSARRKRTERRKETPGQEAQPPPPGPQTPPAVPGQGGEPEPSTEGKPRPTELPPGD